MKPDFDDIILNEDIDALLDDEAPELSNDEDSIVDELINSPAKNSNLKILTKNDAATMKTLENKEFILSIAESLEETKPNSIQGIESKVTSDRVCDQEEASKIGNTDVYEHGKTTPSSVSRSNGTTENITVKDKNDSHTRVTKGVTKALRTDFNDVFDFETLTEEDNLDKWFLEAESDLPEKERISIVKEFEDTFNFKIMSEKDNLNDWLLSAEISSFRDKSKKNLTKVGDKSSLFHDFFWDTEVVRLAVRENRFVSANGIIIVHKEEEKSSVFMDIRLTFIYCVIETEKLGPSWAKLNHN
jgi:hypothetical protein